jgi:hypothetical protein
MARRRRHTAEVILDARDRASREVRKTEDSFDRLQKSTRAAQAQFLAITAAGLALVRGLKVVTDAASTQEDAQNALNAALANFGPESARVSDALQDQATALQNLTRFGDETILQGQALLASFTSNAEAIERGTVAALDFAAATGRDLNTAFLTLGKAAAGSTGELSRYGIVIEEGLDQSQKFEAVLDRINEQFGGRAQAEIRTFSGLMAQLGNTFGDTAEAAGDFIIENETLRDSLQLFRLLLDTVNDSLTENRTETQGLGAANLDFSKSVAAVGAQLEIEARRLGQTLEQSRATRGAFEALTAAGFSAAEAFERLVNAQTRALRLQKQYTAEVETFETFLKEVGAVLDRDVNETLRRYTDQLEFARANQRALGLSAEDLARLERQVAEATRELVISLEGEEEQTDAVAEATRRLAEELGAAEQAQAELGRQTDATTRSLENQQRVASSIRVDQPFSFQGGTFRFVENPATGRVERARVLADGRVVF